MGTLIKNEFKTHNARQFIESLDEASNSIYYVFTGKPQSYTEDSTPTPTDSVTNAQYQVWAVSYTHLTLPTILLV